LNRHRKGAENEKTESGHIDYRRELPFTLLIWVADYFHTTTDYILRGTDAISGKDAFLSEAVNLLREITDERRKTEVLAHLKVMVEYSE